MMNNTTKKIIAIIIAIALVAVFILPIVLGAFSPAYAKSLNEAKQATQQAKDKVNAAKNKKAEAQKQLNAIDAQLNVISAEIKTIEKNIAQLDNDITLKNQEIEDKTRELQEKQAIYDKRISFVYEQGTSGYITILFESDNLADFFDRYELVDQLITYDKEIINSVVEAKKELETAKKDLEDVKTAREAELNSQKEKQVAYEAKQAESKAVFDALAQDVKEYEALFAAAQAEQDKIQALIAARASSTSTKSYIGTGSLQWPTPGYTTVTSNFGYRIHPVTGVKKYHSGTDIAAPTGASILAAASGTVIMAGYNSGGYGNYVVIDHGGGITTLYGHASSLCVSQGQFVNAGQLIAKVGSTGISTGPHLHLEVQVNGQRTNAMSYFR
ncbi:MAG: peptidoglycan DD-metalloendopeptidase family protein [Eubacteriales bacterium]|nr:peptidoglycan DD-metalloendopeptidase family protein [Eubacteriales bacterium]